MQSILGMVQKTRAGYLQALNADALNDRFGGPLFLFCAISSAVYVSALFITEGHGLFDLVSGIDRISREDFLAFFRAGVLAQMDQAVLAYDPASFAEPFSEVNKKLLFLNPPHAFLFFEPLSYLPYQIARGLALLANLAAIYGIVRLARLNLGVGPYVFVFLTYSAYFSLLLLQISPIIIFLLVYALTNGARSPVLSGLALAIATIKPQYGLLVPVFLIGQKDWRTFWIAASAATALIGLSILRYGWPVWDAFLGSSADGAASGHFDQVYTGMITVGQSLGKLWFSSDYRILAQILILPICGSWIWFVVRSLPRDRAIPAVLFAMAAAAPSFFFYDWLMFCAGLLFCLHFLPVWPVHLQVTAGFLWISPLVQMMVYGAGQDVFRAEAARYLSASLPLLMLIVSVQIYFLLCKELAPQGAEHQSAAA